MPCRSSCGAEGYDWHIHAITDQAPLADRITVETAMAMIDVIRADELSRLGICADDSCAGVVLDLSRNRSRRFCSTACSNRNAVAAYRARQADLVATHRSLPGRAARRASSRADPRTLLPNWPNWPDRVLTPPAPVTRPRRAVRC